MPPGESDLCASLATVGSWALTKVLSMTAAMPRPSAAGPSSDAKSARTVRQLALFHQLVVSQSPEVVLYHDWSALIPLTAWFAYAAWLVAMTSRAGASSDWVPGEASGDAGASRPLH